MFRWKMSRTKIRKPFAFPEEKKGLQSFGSLVENDFVVNIQNISQVQGGSNIYIYIYIDRKTDEQQMMKKLLRNYAKAFCFCGLHNSPKPRKVRR